MAGSIGRSISIGLSANTKNFAKSLRSAEKNLERFKNGVKVIGTAVAASFTAMGAAAIFFGKNAVEAAIEDDKAQKQLAKTIKNNTKITKTYQHTIEKSVDALQDQFNITDDKLRPAFSKLITATKSVSKSQKIMRVALDVSAGTGKSLDSVVSALSRAYLGNNTAIGKLGVGIDKTKLKGMSFDQLLKTLSKTMGGQAAQAAGSYAGSVEGIKIAWSEFQESVGYTILPKLKGILEYIKNDLLPWLGDLKDGFTGAKQETISPQLRKVSKAMGLNPDNPKSSAYGLGEAIKTMTVSLEKMFTSLNGGDASGASSTLDTLAKSLTNIAHAITTVTNSVTGAKKWWQKWGGLIGTITGADPGNSGTGPAPTPTPTSMKASGGPIRGGRPYLVGENGPEMFVPSGAGGIRTASQTRGMLGGTVINLNGIVDAESARRSIEQLMRRSSLRTGTVNLNGSIF
jgi:hypothetical protein